MRREEIENFKEEQEKLVEEFNKEQREKLDEQVKSMRQKFDENFNKNFNKKFDEQIKSMNKEIEIEKNNQKTEQLSRQIKSIEQELEIYHFLCKAPVDKGLLIDALQAQYSLYALQEQLMKWAQADEELALSIVGIFQDHGLSPYNLRDLGRQYFSVGKKIINQPYVSVHCVLRPIVLSHNELLPELFTKKEKELTSVDLDNLVMDLGEQALEQINSRPDLLKKLCNFYRPTYSGQSEGGIINTIALTLQEIDGLDGRHVQPEAIIYQYAVAYQLGCRETYGNAASKLLYLADKNPNHRRIIAEKIVKVSKTYKPTGKDRDIFFDAVDPSTTLGEIFYPNGAKEEEDINQVSDGLAILYAEINDRDENKLTPFQKKVVEVNELFEKAGQMEEKEIILALQKYAHCYLEYGHQKSFDRFIVLAAQNKEEAVACIINYAEQGKNTLLKDALNKETTLSNALFPTYKKEGYGKLFQNDKLFHKLIETFEACGYSAEKAFPDLYAREESFILKISSTLTSLSLFGKKDLPPPPSPRSANFNSELGSKSELESPPNQDSLYQL